MPEESFIRPVTYVLGLFLTISAGLFIHFWRQKSRADVRDGRITKAHNLIWREYIRPAMRKFVAEKVEQLDFRSDEELPDNAEAKLYIKEDNKRIIRQHIERLQDPWNDQDRLVELDSRLSKWEKWSCWIALFSAVVCALLIGATYLWPPQPWLKIYLAIPALLAAVGCLAWYLKLEDELETILGRYKLYRATQHA